MTTALHILLATSPVVLFLLLLTFLDSYRLTPLRFLLRSVIAGIVVALVSYAVIRLLLETGLVDVTTMRRFTAPVLEEVFKSLFLVFLIRSRRVGFLVDSAIHGFAIGTGFAVVENLYYLRELEDGGLMLWVVRGFGTAIMHPSTTAIIAIVAKGLTDSKESTGLRWFVPGLIMAVAIHTAYNQRILPPLMSTTLLLAVLPPVVLYVFSRSERATRQWLGTGFDTDVELLEQFHSGSIGETRVGRYLDSLTSHFPGAIVADMLCLLEIRLELAARAKGILLARKSGLSAPIGPGVLSRLEEMRYLEKTIGPTGRRALEPIMTLSSRDLWQVYMLEQEPRRPAHEQ